MNINKTKEQVKALLPDLLLEAGINPKRPFRCICPDHQDNHPSMVYDRKRNKVHCFGCGADMDIYDVYGMLYGISDTKEIFEKTNEWAEGKQTSLPPVKAEAPPVKLDLNDAVRSAHQEMHKNVNAYRHFKDRKLSDDVIEEYGLGYSEKGFNSMLDNYPKHQSRSWKESYYKYIIPYLDENGDYYYLQAEIFDRNEMDDFNGKYRKPTGISEPVFNERYLKKNTPDVIFVVEGIYDALSVESVGGKAIALGGTGHRRFLLLCQKWKPNTTFLISMDNDEAGDQCRDDLLKGLNDLGIPAKVCSVYSGKDFNEALKQSPEALRYYVQRSIWHAKHPSQVS